MSNLKLVIGNKNYSSWSLRPWLYLKNLNIDFEEEMVFLFEEETNQKLSSYFSNEKVPVLVDSSYEDALQVWDTLSIIEYLAENYSGNKGWPTDQRAKSVARSLSAEMHSGFGALREALPMNCRKDFPNYPITSAVQEDVNRISSVWEYAKKNYGQNGDWLFGEFSGADAMFAPVIIRLKGYDVKLTGYAAEYVEMVYNSEHMQDWINTGKKETQIILEDEV